MTKRMYFGTRERMTWIKCPSVDAGLSSVGWQSTSQYINGGAGVRRSSTGHKEFEFVWPMANAYEAGLIKNYSNGVHGEGLIYFLDPFAFKTNVLPPYWAAPRLAREDAPPFTIGRRPTLVNNGPNALGYPSHSAAYDFKDGDQFSTLFIPVPEGYTFHFGAHGGSTGDAGLTITREIDSVPQTPDTVTLLDLSDTARTNYTASGISGVTISFTGVGSFTVAGMIAQVRPDGEDVPGGEFIGGEGHSGCKFEGFPTVVGYSSPQALDKQSVSARLIETGAWE